MMATKSWLICGVPRSGKTVLSRRAAAEFGLSHLHVDGLIDAFSKVFPENGISHDGESHAQLCQALRPFLTVWLERHRFYGIPFIADSYHILLKDAAELGEKLHLGVMCIGYPKVNPEARLRELRSNSAPDDWAAKVDDEKMLEGLQKFSAYSERMREECSELGIHFVDTGPDFSGVIEATILRMSEIQRNIKPLEIRRDRARSL